MSATSASLGSAQTTEASAAPEVSFVIPCLNEEASIALVVAEAREAIGRLGISGEIVVVDNGSDDRSAELARAAGARVVDEPRRGYGSAYLAGLAAARGRYLVLTDADASYDLARLPEFLDELRAGSDLVLGSRFRGTIMPGAMPWSHRWIGNPVLTGMLNLLFHVGVSDAHCGLRALRREALAPLELQTTGMEFASEMVIKAAKRGLRITEIPIVYRPREGESKLNSLRDAWRHVRFMLVHSATFLFLLPGTILVVGGLGLLIPLAVNRDLGDPEWAVPLAIFASFLTLVGAQVVQLGLFARTYAVVYMAEEERMLESLWRRFRLEHGLALAAITLVVGIAITLVGNFNGVPDPALGLLGLTLAALGVQAIFGAFFLSILGLPQHAIRRRRASPTEPPQE
ncbi:MAG: glycosyltransferase family 2 protein [Actinomycetota bacterium]|nr:glycosyltransferase family 2 protein [Actinomycetota bacterium]